MPRTNARKPLAKWFTIYLLLCALGSLLLSGFLPATALTGWAWWQRLLLVLLTGPLALALYALLEALFEGSLRTLAFFLKVSPLPTLVVVLAAVTLLWVAWSFLASALA